MTTKVNEFGLTTETTVYRVGKVDGPFTRKPTGKFRQDGETPIYAKCEPYWIVRVMFGKSASIMQDRKFFSLASAQEFFDSLPAW